MNITRLKVEDLRNELRKRGLDTEGTRPVLLKRLRAALDRHASVGKSVNPAKLEASATDEVLSQYHLKSEPTNSQSSTIRPSSTHEKVGILDEAPLAAIETVTSAEPDTFVNEEPSRELAENPGPVLNEQMLIGSIPVPVEKRDEDGPLTDNPDSLDDAEAVRRRQARFGSVLGKDASVDKAQTKDIVLSAEELIRRRRKRFGLPSVQQSQEETEKLEGKDNPKDAVEANESNNDGALQRRQRRFGTTVGSKKTRNNLTRQGQSRITKDKPSKNNSRVKTSITKNRSQEKIPSALSSISRAHNVNQASSIGRGKRSRLLQDDDRSYSSDRSRDGNDDPAVNRVEFNGRGKREHRVNNYERDSRDFSNARNYRGERINEYDNRYNRNYTPRRDNNNMHHADRGSHDDRTPDHYRRIHDDHNDQFRRDNSGNRTARNTHDDYDADSIGKNRVDREPRYSHNTQDIVGDRHSPAVRIDRAASNDGGRYHDYIPRENERNTPRLVTNRLSKKRVRQHPEESAKVSNQTPRVARNMTSEESERRLKRQRRFQVVA